jgi:hypothetical protein
MVRSGPHGAPESHTPNRFKAREEVQWVGPLIDDVETQIVHDGVVVKDLGDRVLVDEVIQGVTHRIEVPKSFRLMRKG